MRPATTHSPRPYFILTLLLVLALLPQSLPCHADVGHLPHYEGLSNLEPAATDIVILRVIALPLPPPPPPTPQAANDPTNGSLSPSPYPEAKFLQYRAYVKSVLKGQLHEGTTIALELGIQPRGLVMTPDLPYTTTAGLPYDGKPLSGCVLAFLRRDAPTSPWRSVREIGSVLSLPCDKRFARKPDETPLDAVRHLLRDLS